MRTTSLLAAAVFVLVGSNVGWAQGPDLSQPLPIDPAVRVGRLENGLTYMIRENGEPAARAALRLVVDAGSVLEDDDQRGLAHFLEHMAFNGSEHFAKQELIDYMESIGMSFGPHVNAYTSFDETVYMLAIPTDSQSIVRNAFQILEDWAHLITLDPEEIEKERGVVVEEWRARRSAGMRMLERQIPVLLGGSKYAERLPIGLVETIQTAPREAVTRFYEDWYRPDLMTVIAVGDFDADVIEALIHERFASVPVPASPRPRPTMEVPSHDETLYAIMADPEQTNTTVQVLQKQAPRDESSVGAYRQLIAEALYGDMLNSRFMEITQRPDAPLLFGAAGRGNFVRAMDAYQLFAGVAADGVERGLESLLTEGERVAQHGFTEGELRRARARLLRGMEQAFAERDNRRHEMLADEYVRHTLQGEPIPGIEIEYQLYQMFLPTIQLAELNRMAEELNTDADRAVIVAAPEMEGTTLPTEAELGAVFEHVAQATVDPYEDTAVEAPLLADVPAGTPVVAEDRLEAVDVTVWELGNGVRVLLKPTDFKDDEVAFQAYSPGGASLLSDEEYARMFAASQIVAQGGVGDFSAVDLRNQLSGKAASVSPSIADLTEGLSGSASPQDLETLFQLIYLHVTAPRKDPMVFAAFQQQAAGFLENRSASPQAAFSDTIAVTMAQGHPRATPISAARVQGLDLDESFAFYQDRFADASDFTFVFVGAFTLDEMRPLVERYLGGLPAMGREEQWRDTGIRPPEGVIRKEVHKGLEPQSMTQIIFTGPFDYTPENRHLVRSLVAAFDIRLTERLREDLGGTYSPQVGSGYSKEPYEGYTIRVGFGSDPARVDELVDAVFAEIEEFQTAGPRPEHVEAVAESQRRSKETDLENNQFWLANLMASDMYGQDPSFLLDYGLIESLTVDALREAAIRYFDRDNYVIVTLYPEAQQP